uniref:tRNA-uridine aminocarboxypropyltransferase n=1 Tax=Labrus bergylta TaxID=56723 RepID=A0A3Q3EWR5_9LABR
LPISPCSRPQKHPAEVKQGSSHGALLAACLPTGKCKVIEPELAAVCRDSRTLILYPGPKSQNLEEIVRHVEPGQNMFLKNSLFHLPKQVSNSTDLSSQYVIRTQPSNICLSTLECAAVALSILERNDDIQEVLLRPLKALCSFQLEHGAQVHHSKEHLLKNGMYDKPMPKNKRKIKRMEKLVTDHAVCPR